MRKAILIFFIFANLVNAQTFPLVTTKCEQGRCTWADFIATLQRAIRAILIVSYWVAALCGLAGALMVMLGGAVKTLDLGKNLLRTATIGYAVVLGAGIIFDLFLEFLKPQLVVPQ